MLDRFVSLVTRRPGIMILAFTILTLVISSQAIHINIRPEIEAYLPQDEPTVSVLSEVSGEWSTNMMMLYVEADDVLDPEVLRALDDVTSRIDYSPEDGGAEDGVMYVMSIPTMIKTLADMTPHDLLSLANIMPQDASGVSPSPELEDIKVPPELLVALLAHPQDPLGETLSEEQLVSILFSPQSQRMLSQSPIVESMMGKLITPDHGAMAAMLTLPPPKEFDPEKMGEFTERVNLALKGLPPGIKIGAMGGPLSAQEAMDKSFDYMKVILPLSVLLICLAVLLFHRTWKMMIIAGLGPLYGLGLTYGTLGILRLPLVPFMLVGVAPILMSLGVAYSFHLANRYADEVKKRGREESLAIMMRSCGRAVLLSAITTMVGFGSLMVSNLPPMFYMGFAEVIGIGYCFLAAIILVPSLIALLGYEKKGRIRPSRRLARISTNHPRAVMCVAVPIALISLLCFPALSTDFSYEDLMPQDTPSMMVAAQYMETFGLTEEGIILAYGDIRDPAVVASIDSLQEDLSKIDETKAYSIVDAIKSLNGGSLPSDPVVLGRILDQIKEGSALFSMPVALSETKNVIYVDTKVTSFEGSKKTVYGINEVIDEHANDHCTFSVFSGASAMMVAINDKLMWNQTASLVVAIVLVLICLMVIFYSVRYGLATMTPLLLVICLQPGLMMILGLSYTIANVMIASIIVGVGIDFGVHITQRTKDELGRLPPLEAVREAVESTGASLMEVTTFCVAGLVPMFYLPMPIVWQFLVLFILLLVASCVAAMLVLPSIYVLGFGTKGKETTH